ncbi:unnamed protein product [Rhodiola kirilowii]
MGFISRNIFPACGNMCICCPAMRSRSRQPVKRYKKLLAGIFPKSLDGSPDDRKIVKLCEYAAKNPFRIPKIAKYLEERYHKELRLEHLKYVTAVVETYNKLLSICKDQIAYFAVSLLSTVTELLDNHKHEKLQILGCQTLTRFIYSQADATYAHNIETFVHKVCDLARKGGGEQQVSCLRAYSLQCLAAMVWLMAENSHIFDEFDEIMYATLDNYELAAPDENVRRETHHNWVDEVVRCEGRAGAKSFDLTSSMLTIRPRPIRKDPNSLTRDEMETPKIWAQICIQRMVDLAEERTTMRRVLDPMLVYFDKKGQWVPQHGLALVVLSDISYLVEATGNQVFILAAVVRHLDHKNVAHDPKIKSLVIQVAIALVRLIRSEGGALYEIGYINDLCRHLRKCLQATIKSSEDQEISSNISLQNSIEDFLLEVAKGIDEVQPIFDIMAIMLERLLLLEDEVVAKATIGCLLAIAHMIALAPCTSKSHQGFPEAIFVHLLKVMVHPNIQTRLGAHRIFGVLLTANFESEHETASLRYGFHHQPKNWQVDTEAAHNSISTLLEKLRKEKDSVQAEKHNGGCVDSCNEKVLVGEKKQMHTQKSSSLYKVSSFIDKTSGAVGLSEAEPYFLKLTEDQVSQLLSSFWTQANLVDNLPSNIEAISHSFSLTLISSRLQDLSDNLVVRFFQLPLSIRTIALDSSGGTIVPACQRSNLVLSTGMLLFVAKIFHVLDQTEWIKLLLPCDVDPHLAISDDFQVYVNPHTDAKIYYSLADNEEAVSILAELKQKINESNNILFDMVVRSLSLVTKLEAEDITRQLSQAFTPDDSYMLDARMGHDSEHNHRKSESKESLSFDEDVPANLFVEDDATSESTVSDLSRFIPKVPASPSVSQIINIRQLLDASLEVAGQVAGTTVSTSPLPYSSMTSQCEALGTGNRKKLTNWLVYDNHFAKSLDYRLPTLSIVEYPEVMNITSDDGCITTNGSAADPWMAIKLPPASPFDNFLRAAHYSNGSDRELAISGL